MTILNRNRQQTRGNQNAPQQGIYRPNGGANNGNPYSLVNNNQAGIISRDSAISIPGAAGMVLTYTMTGSTTPGTNTTFRIGDFNGAVELSNAATWSDPVADITIATQDKQMAFGTWKIAALQLETSVTASQMSQSIMYWTTTEVDGSTGGGKKLKTAQTVGPDAYTRLLRKIDLTPYEYWLDINHAMTFVVIGLVTAEVFTVNVTIEKANRFAMGQ
ncbi:MAG: hypothetical protein ABL951_04235 [Alphaproteobacteria bacterium]